MEVPYLVLCVCNGELCALSAQCEQCFFKDPRLLRSDLGGARLCTLSFSWFADPRLISVSLVATTEDAEAKQRGAEQGQ